MKPLAWRSFAVRIILGLAALAMAVMAGCGPRSIAGLGLLLTSVLVAEYAHASGHERVVHWSLFGAWALSPWIVLTLVTGHEKVFSSYLAFMVWLTSAAVSPFRKEVRVTPAFWRMLGVAWLCFGTGIALGVGYLFDTTLFMLGLASLIGTILVLLWWFKLPRVCIQTLITLLLVVAGLPVVSALIRPRPGISEPITNFERYYSYEAAKKDPEAYAAWTDYSMVHWMQFERAAMERKLVDGLPWRLRPNTKAKLYNSEVPINSLGFRGREFSPQKTNTYRIVAIGESSTFGITLTPDHHPWPEVLESLLRERLKLKKNVEVINAGFPGRGLAQNVHRLNSELLALEPDMLISYHGYNSFYLLNRAIPPASGPPPPAYAPRPLKLLADLEYRVKLGLYRSTRTARPGAEAATFSDPLQTPYADAYRELIQVAETNHVQLVLANFSMAVNSRSDPDLIQFYRQGFPAIDYQIKANQAHSAIVEKLAAEHSDVCFVDTHPKLDGQHQKFIDLVHFNKQGEQEMAETFFAAIRPILERKLGNY